MYKVMIVDDEPFIRQGLMVLINWEKYGFEICCEADNGIEAFEQAKIFKPELIITDIKMPEMGGLELIKKCEEELLIASKYIVLSGFNDFEYAQKAMRFSIVNYILKPVDEDELIESLNKVKEELDLKIKKLLTNGDYRGFVSGLLKEFAYGRIEEKKLDKIKHYIFNYESGVFVYIVLQPVNWQHSLEHTEGDDYAIITEVRKVILDIIGKSMSIYVIDEDIGLGLVVSEKMFYKYDNSLNSMLQIIVDDIFKKISLQVIVYTGKSVKGISLIKESRDTCMNAINTNFLLSRKGIVSCERIKDVLLNYSPESNRLFEELMESVEKSNFNKINENIEIIYKELRTKCVAPELIKANIASFELELIKLITNMNGDVKELTNSIRNLQLDHMVISDVKEALRDFCVIASKYMMKLKENKKSGILYKVQEYINVNYYQDIRLKNISQHFYINTIYLGQIFKKKFGISFNDYLNNYRIEKAKQLIDSKKFDICKISSMVGYNDLNYFISNFEKITKTTPSEYERNV